MDSPFAHLAHLADEAEKLAGKPLAQTHMGQSRDPAVA